jgi:hypothetical protein
MDGGRKRGRWQRQRDANVLKVTLGLGDLNPLKRPQSLYGKMARAYQEEMTNQPIKHQRRGM